MATHAAPRTSSPAPSNDDNLVTLTGTGAKVSLPRWAKTIVIIATVVGSVGGTIAGLRNHIAGDDTTDAKSKLADFQIAESRKHSAEDFSTIPIASSPSAENLQLRYYRSDGCIQVARRTTDGYLNSSYFVPRINMSDIQPPPGPVGDVQHVRTGSTRSPGDGSLHARLLPDRFALAAFAMASAPQLTSAQSCTGHCADPHPGEPKTTNGKTNGCWIQVIRTWDDGCSQYQWYDTCHSIWDPKIYWSCCKH